MAIDLPPPSEPLPFAHAQIRAYGDAAEVQTHLFGDARIHVAGGPPIAPAAITTALADATTLSDAVRGIGFAYYRAGYPATQVYYTRLGQDLHLLVLPGRIEAVIGPAGLRRYFEDLTDAPALRAADLEPARALASVHAARSGRRLQLRLAPGSAPGRFHLVLEDLREPESRPRLRLQIGNPGSRFVGRDFFDAEATLGGGGGELRVLRRQSLDGERLYREHAGSVGVVSPRGMFAVEGRRVDYTQRSAATPLAGRVSSVALSWSGLPYADFQSRWVAGLRVSAVRDTLSSSTSETLLEQSYTSAQLSLSRARRSAANPWAPEWQAAAILDAGLDGREINRFGGGTPSTGFLSLRPSLALQLSPEAAGEWTLGAELQGQLTNDTLPRQQQFVLGGDQALAAWLPGVIVADHGYLLRLHASRALSASAWTLRPRLFAELGGGRFNGSDAGTTNTDALADAGLELGLEHGSRLSARIVAAMPLIEPDVLKPALDALRAEVYFQLSVNF